MDRRQFNKGNPQPADVLGGFRAMPKEKARAAQAKGGRISARNATFKAALYDILSEVTDENGDCYRDVVMKALLRKAESGDIRAIELATKIMGELKEQHELVGDISINLKDE